MAVVVGQNPVVFPEPLANIGQKRAVIAAWRARVYLLKGCSHTNKRVSAFFSVRLCPTSLLMTYSFSSALTKLIIVEFCTVAPAAVAAHVVAASDWALSPVAANDCHARKPIRYVRDQVNAHTCSDAVLRNMSDGDTGHTHEIRPFGL